MEGGVKESSRAPTPKELRMMKAKRKKQESLGGGAPGSGTRRLQKSASAPAGSLSGLVNNENKKPATNPFKTAKTTRTSTPKSQAVTLGNETQRTSFAGIFSNKAGAPSGTGSGVGQTTGKRPPLAPGSGAGSTRVDDEAAPTALDYSLLNMDSSLMAPPMASSTAMDSKEPAVNIETECPVLDWSLKSLARFQSSRPFAWSRVVPDEMAVAGMAAFTSNADTVPGEKKDRDLAEFQRALMCWQYPEEPLPQQWLNLYDPKAPVTGPKSSPQMQYLHLRHRKWMSALESVFKNLQSKSVPYFYYSAEKFTALFTAAGVRSKGSMAILSRSTVGLRRLLKDREVNFTMPLVDSHEDAEPLDTKDPDLKAEYDEFIQAAPHMAAEEENPLEHLNNQPRSMLVVQNRQNLMRLVDVLKNDALEINHFRVNDLPTLIAPSAFLHASLSQAQPIQRDRVRTENEATEGAQFVLDIKGVPAILPTTVLRLCELMRYTQKEAGFKVTFTSLNHQEGINHAPPPTLTRERSLSESQSQASMPATPTEGPKGPILAACTGMGRICLTQNLLEERSILDGLNYRADKPEESFFSCNITPK